MSAKEQTTTTTGKAAVADNNPNNNSNSNIHKRKAVVPHEEFTIEHLKTDEPQGKEKKRRREQEQEEQEQEQEELKRAADAAAAAEESSSSSSSSSALLLSLEVKEQVSDVVQKQIADLAKLIREAKHFVMYTGPGIVDLANDTETLRRIEDQTAEDLDQEFVFPGVTHMAIAELVRSGYLKHVVTECVDGLHVMSGIPLSQVSELLGNKFTEQCPNCDDIYIRDFPVRTSIDEALHETGRKCLTCDGDLEKGDIPDARLEKAKLEMVQSDLMLLIGVSEGEIQVAKSIPLLTTGNHKLVVCEPRSIARRLTEVTAAEEGSDETEVREVREAAEAAEVITDMSTADAEAGRPAVTRIECSEGTLLRLLMKELKMQIPHFVFDLEFTVGTGPYKWAEQIGGRRFPRLVRFFLTNEGEELIGTDAAGKVKYLRRVQSFIRKLDVKFIGGLSQPHYTLEHEPFELHVTPENCKKIDVTLFLRFGQPDHDIVRFSHVSPSMLSEDEGNKLVPEAESYFVQRHLIRYDAMTKIQVMHTQHERQFYSKEEEYNNNNNNNKKEASKV